jgi:thiamine pyrophosphate-dependent acetolactate synthase large subunit-like protein
MPRAVATALVWLAMRVYEGVVEELERHYISTIFGLIGQDTMRLSAVAIARGLKYVSARHEVGAVTMAAGFARLSSTVGVAVVSRGPGLTNAMSGIVAAAKTKAPLLILSGDEPLVGDKYADPKYIDQTAMLVAAGIQVIRPQSAPTALVELRRAIEQARRGATVVALFPLDVLEAVVGSIGEAEESAVEIPLDPDRAAIRSAADVVEACGVAARTLVLAGRGAVASDSLAELEDLGSVTGGLMGTSLMAKSFFDHTPRNVGIVGTFTAPWAKRLLLDTDLVIAVGASLNPFTTQKGQLFPEAALIQIDSDPHALGQYVHPRVGIRGDAKRTVSALATELARRGFEGYGYPYAGNLEGLRRAAATATRPSSDTGDPLNPHDLMVALDGILPKDRAVVVDAGHQLTFACTHLSVPSPADFVFPIEFQCIGVALGTAIGAAMTQSHEVTIVSLGDGALMMGLGELDTAIRYRLPLIVLVVNDSGFGAERHYLEMLGLPADTARFVNPSFEEVALSMGADAMTIRDIRDLDALPGKLSLPLPRPLVIDCHVDENVRADWLELNLRREPVEEAQVE